MSDAIHEDDLSDDELLDTEGPAVEVRDLRSAFGSHIIHDGLNLTVNRGEVLAVVGGSGSGKSVLLNTVIGLKRPDAGVVRVFGQDIEHASRRRWSAIDLPAITSVGLYWRKLRGSVLSGPSYLIVGTSGK